MATVGSCLLSAGVFRGDRSLTDVIRLGVEALARHVYPGLETICVAGFTPEEQTLLADLDLSSLGSAVSCPGEMQTARADAKTSITITAASDADMGTVQKGDGESQHQET